MPPKVDEIRVYSSESAVRKPSVIFREMWQGLVKGKDLALRLTIRDIRSQYRQSILGILWAFIPPLANTIIWIFLGSTGIINFGETDIPYPAYVFSGTLLWAIFMEALAAPLQRTNGARGMLARINFPKESIILSGIYQVAFNGAIKVALLIAGLLILGVYPDWTVVFFPLSFISLILIGTSIGLLITPIGLLYTDIGRALPMAMQFIMYITPVIFPMPKTGWVEQIFLLNPLSSIILTSRNLLTGGELEYLLPFFIINIVFFVLLLIAWIIYRAAMPVLVERMSA